MIWTILIGTILVLSILGVFTYFNTDLIDDTSLDLIAGLGITFSSVIMAIFIAIIICSHVDVDYSIKQYEFEYESLVKRVECIDSEYEDVSRSDVLEDVYKWNKRVYSEKYWSNNPWTNWFYSKRFVDSLKYIELEDD